MHSLWRPKAVPVVALLAVVSLQLLCTSAHPWCVPDGTPTIPSPPLQYCRGYNDWPGACCTRANEESFTKNVVDTIISSSANQACYKHVKEAYCAFCSPLSAHKFNVENGGESGLGTTPTLCTEFCRRLYSACGNVELNTDGPLTISGSIMRIPGLQVGQGMRKISELYPTADEYCKAFASTNVGACHTDNPAELNEQNNQMPGVPYQLEYAYPKLNLNNIPKANAKEKVQYECLWRTAAVLTQVGSIVDMIPYGDGTDRVVVTIQTGLVLLFDNDPNVEQYTILLDHRSKTAYEDPTEIGFLGVAFHPDFNDNGWMFAKYTPRPNLDYIVRFTKKSGVDEMDPSTEFLLLALDKEDTMHHGGSPIFGPHDKMLYVAVGDGIHFAKCYRAENPAPLLTSLLGKVLRLDVSGPGTNGRPYRIPPDNPYAGTGEGREEIWAYGLRNPWKMTFDPPTRNLWLGDVGYALWEEIDIIVPGQNYGWHRREAAHCFYPKGESCPAVWGEASPIFEYPHEDSQCARKPCLYGRAIAGGYVYRGTRVPSLNGVYLFADYSVGTLWMLNADPVNLFRNSVTRMQPLFPKDFPTDQFFVASYGIDSNSEVYILNWQQPNIFRFARELRPPPIPPPEYTVNNSIPIDPPAVPIEPPEDVPVAAPLPPIPAPVSPPTKQPIDEVPVAPVTSASSGSLTSSALLIFALTISALLVLVE